MTDEAAAVGRASGDGAGPRPDGPAYEPLAVVGVGCRFPGGVNGPADFWRLLAGGGDAVTEVPADRWDARSFYAPEPGRPGKTNSRWGGFLADLDRFDADFFGISPREAACMDPQHRLLLCLVWEALEDAGLVPERLAGSDTGVYIGISTQDYGMIQSSMGERPLIDAYTNIGVALCLAANRVSYAFDFRGPSLAVDTACSSSLVALHLAAQALWGGECGLAIVGGVNVVLRPESTIGFSQAGMLSPDGRCKSFDAAANGYVRSEGAGVVVLKPRARAEADGDPIYSLVRGTAANQDGRSSSIAVPNGAAHEELLRGAYGRAGVDPGEVGYVEAHGTGTPVGDPIEAAALGAVLGRRRAPDRPCLIGSVKSNLGHMEAAAGIAGLIKVALSLRYGQLPPSLHFRTPNPQIPFAELGLRLSAALEPWPGSGNGNGGGRRVAGVNSFGFGGTNAHAVLEAAPDRPPPPPGDACAVLVPLSARRPEALRDLARSWVDYLGAGGAGSALPLVRVAATAGARRSHHEYRLAAVGADHEGVAGRLRAFLAGEGAPGLAAGRRVAGRRPALTFVFPGMGPQWWGMGRQLLAEELAFRDAFREVDRRFRTLAGWSLLDELGKSEAASRVQEAAVAQPALFAIQVALAALWRDWGVEPDAVVGHSLGEVAAAHAAGALGLDDAVALVFHRSRLQQQAAGRGTLMAVGASPAEVEPLLASAAEAGRVEVAAVNGPRALTLTGTADALDALAARLPADVFRRRLHVDVPYHSAVMEDYRDELTASLRSLRPRDARVPLVSTVTGGPARGEELDAAYWWRNVRDPVRFADAVGHLLGLGHDLFLEIGPHPVLAASIAECQAGRAGTGNGNGDGDDARTVTVLPSLRRGEPERETLLAALGALYVRGREPDWRRVQPGADPPVELPRYPWQGERHWRESDDSRRSRLGLQVHPLLGNPVRVARPTWSVEVDLDALGFLRDHRVHGAAVFPGTAYVELGLAVARQVFGPGPAVLEDFEFLKACVLPDGPPLTMQVELLADQATVEVSSLARASGAEWVRHATGKLRREATGSAATTPPAPVALDAIVARCPTEIGHDESYARLAQVGLGYGPAFRGVERVWCAADEAIGQVRGPDPGGDGGPYLLHPAFLDACWQVLVGALFGGGRAGGLDDGLYLPVGVERVRVLGGLTGRVWSHARVLERGTTRQKGDVRVYDEAGHLLVEVQGLTSRRVGASGRPPVDMNTCLYEPRWRWQPRAVGPEAIAPAPPLPTPRALEGPLQELAGRLSERLGRRRYYEVLEPKTRPLATAYVLDAFRQLGRDLEPGQRFEAAALAGDLGIAPQHLRLFGRILSILGEEGVLKGTGGGWEVVQVPERIDLERVWSDYEAWAEFSAFSAELTLVRRCGRQLAGVLRGAVDPLELIFPQGSATVAEHLYQDAPTYRIYNLLVRDAVRRIVGGLPGGRTLRALEIGGGTGGLAAYVLPVLPARQVEYTFTDVSPLFLAAAEPKLGDFRFVTTRPLDIEADAAAQGFAPHAYDLVLASDVLHTTADLRDTVRRVRGLLAPGGLLVLLEGTKCPHWGILVFGLLKGWWKFTDIELRGDDPWITADGWRGLLEGEGFTEVVCVTDRLEGAGEGLHTVILARGPDPIPDATAPADAAPANDEAGAWLVFADGSGVGRRVADGLAARGGRPVIVTPGDEFREAGPGQFEVRPSEPADLERLLSAAWGDDPSWRGVVHLWGLDAADPRGPAALGCDSVLGLVQALSRREAEAPPRLWMVTAGVQAAPGAPPTAPHQATLWGLGRVVINEFPALRCTLVDLGPGHPAEDVEALVAELLADDAEQEIALRGPGRYVHRLERTSLAELQAARANGPGAAVPYRAEVATPGILRSIELRAAERRPPGPGEVEIAVEAVGLNFKDVVLALGLLPAEAFALGYTGAGLGVEAAGTVVNVGPGVEGLAVGDDVIGFGPSALGTHITVDARIVLKRPAALSAEEAAGLPVAFTTAHYGLNRLARLAPGERVLIHSAAGGVGLAAVQLARLAGAEVFATAGNPEKREFLQALGVRHVMDSRTLDFADEVRDLTGGRGVHVVLNSLAGEAQLRSLATLAHGGRFVEIGKQDIYANRRLELRPFRHNLAFFAVDLDRLMREQPDLVGELGREVLALIRERRIVPLPHRVLPVTAAAAAFQYLAQAKQVGRVVVSLDGAGAAPPVPLAPPLRLRDDATYLITGGLGGFGLATARWLARLGARHLVLVGRSGAAAPKAAAAVAALRDAGVEVEVEVADVARPEQLAGVLDRAGEAMPPLRGVIHAAMTLDDAFLSQLTPERLARVLDPKAVGAWNLHTATAGLELDFFVLYSSFSAILGSPGQGNYAAANAALDALAYYRRALGLPALSVNWGVVGDVGYVAERPGLGLGLIERLGAEALSSEVLLDVLGELIRRGATRVAVGRINWRQLATTNRIGKAPLVAHLVAEGSDPADGALPASERLGSILAAPPGERGALLREHVRQQVAGVMGTAPDRVDVDRPLTQSGLDSLMAFELKSRLERDLHVEISPMKLMDGLTVAGLAALLDAELSGVVARPPAPPPPGDQGVEETAAPPTPPPTPAGAAAAAPQEILDYVGRLSDDEVDALLRVEMGGEMDPT